MCVRLALKVAKIRSFRRQLTHACLQSGTAFISEEQSFCPIMLAIYGFSTQVELVVVTVFLSAPDNNSVKYLCVI